ncbi:zinc transporter ZIP6-like [Argiope bruennichi]|uniref:zinc transporter ZIP6-like n=1 Tax=Argiope bruennichi TaxID=94029 RepID=UPI0024951249|nr:zinc transporter ZIP6-like [Argiope bruennichi]
MAVSNSRALLILVVSCCLHVTVRGNIIRLFSTNPPDFVNVSDLRASIRTVVDNLGNRLRCDEHGLKHAECVKCLDTDNIIQLLKLDPLSKSVSRQSAEDLAVFLAHQILYFESMCISFAKGCASIEGCEDEVLEVMGRYSTSTESLVKVLRIFKLYLKEGDSKKCFSAEEVLNELPYSYNGKDAVKETRHLFAVVMGRIIEGKCIDIGESTTDFLDDIFHHYGDNCSPYMSLDGLKRMIHDLQSGKGNDHDHSHHHSHHHDNANEDVHECDHVHGHFAHSHHDHNHDHEHDHPHADNYRSHPHHGPIHNHHDHDHSGHDHGHDHSHDHGDADDFHDYFRNKHASSLPKDKTTAPNRDSNQSDGAASFVTESSTPVPSEKTTEGEINTSKTTVYFEASDMEASNDTSTIPQDKTSETPLSSDDSDFAMNRSRRSTMEEKDFIAPAASLRSDLSHPEKKHRIEMHQSSPSPRDDVKKVYLLQNEEHNRYVDLEPSGIPHQFASLASKCLSPEDLMQKFGHRENSTITKSDFLELCPALIQQIVSGVCTDSALPPPPLPSRMETYGYGSLSVFIISLTSLAGVLLLPIMTKRAYNYIISGFYGLAFSTLAADALLHLMPQFLGLHTHGPGEDHGHSHEGGYFEPYAQLQLGVFFTIYGLFLFESIMCAIQKTDHHSHGQESKGHGHSHVHLPDELPTLISVKTKSETQLPVSRDQSSSSLDTEIVEVEAIKKPPNLMVNKPIFLGLTSMAIVVTLGDSIHNFGDGLAIGAAFSTGIRGGLSTSIAVFCHELPHEFGDFVVLLSTGLSFSKALWINFLSGLTCFVGLYIGILIGDNEVARQWVMAVTAGIFLYVALGEMLPELREHHQGSRAKMLLVKNIGILAGIAIMVLISIYEQELV